MQDVMPRELSKVVLPADTIEPPDILVIDAIHVVPRPPYHLRALDQVSVKVQRDLSDPLQQGDILVVQIQGLPAENWSRPLQPGDAVSISVHEVLTEAPIDGQFQVSGDGMFRLRVPRYLVQPDGTRTEVGEHDYGTFEVAGKTLEEAREDILNELGKTVLTVQSVAMSWATAPTPVDHEFQVVRNGDIVLPWPYGPISVGGLAVEEAYGEIRARVAKFYPDPIVTVSLAESAATPIDNVFHVQIDGRINLNIPARWSRSQTEPIQPPVDSPSSPDSYFQPVYVVGLTLQDAADAIRSQFTSMGYFRDIQVSTTLVSSGATQQIAGEHMVISDGTVTLGSYGSVSVVGLTLAQAKLAIEHHLTQFLADPEVSVDVFSFNSKVYYIVTQGAGMGDGVYRFPITGNETVLDAISNINGLESVSSKRMWIARPTPDPNNVQVLPVSWETITAQASTSTNYQILPGDRIFIAEDKLIAFDMGLSKLIAPVERIVGFTLLGTSTAGRLSGNVLRNASRGGGGFGGGF